MIWTLPQRLFNGPLRGRYRVNTVKRLSVWRGGIFLLSPRKKAGRKFFSRFQEAAIELFTLSCGLAGQMHCKVTEPIRPRGGTLNTADRVPPQFMVKSR